MYALLSWPTSSVASTAQLLRPSTFTRKTSAGTAAAIRGSRTYRVFARRDGVIIIDMLKTIVPVVIGRVLFRNFYDMEIYGSILPGCL